MAALIDFFWSQSTPLLILFFICSYYASLAFYRIYLSPLAKFPGPKLAALTYWLEFYHDVTRRGQYTFEIAKLHEKYGYSTAEGPIVRITPDELHINDVDYYEELYPGSHKPTEKSPSSAGAFGNSGSVLSTVPHNLHKMRRGALNPFFSKRSVIEYSSLIQASVDKLCTRLEEFQESQTPLDLRVAFAALTVDIISMYSYGRSYDSLAKTDMDPSVYRNIASGGELGLLLNQYPWILKIANLLPYRLVALLDSNVTAMINRRNEIEAQVQAIMTSTSQSPKQTLNSPTIFHELINSDIPPQERSISRLTDEGITLIGAGTVTTAHVLSTTAYHVLASPSILSTLQKELEDAIPDTSKPLPPLVKLEHLPYLTAVIKEGLRLTHAISHRNARVAPNRTLKFQRWTIPPGTLVSMTTYFLHTDPAVYAEPQLFRPERWLHRPTTADDSTPLEKYLLPFGKGSRICLGMNLAYAELYMTLAAVVRGFDLQLFETGRGDVEVVHDFVAGAARLDSKGVRVIVQGKRR